jgi:chorismate mutase-like protein
MWTYITPELASELPRATALASRSPVWRNEMTTSTDDLTQRRVQIDTLDSQLLRLLNQRAQVVLEVGSIKRSFGLPVHDPQREKTILDRLCDLNQGPLDSQSVTTLFRCIIRESRKIEENSLRCAQENYSFQQENCNGDQNGRERIRSRSSTRD